MNIVKFDKWEKQARKIISAFALETEMYIQDDTGLYERVKNPVEFLQHFDDSRCVSGVLYHLYTGGRTDWAEELTDRLENKLIEESYILNPDYKDIADFEDDFLENHFFIEKQYVYEFINSVDKARLIETLQQKEKKMKKYYIFKTTRQINYKDQKSIETGCTLSDPEPEKIAEFGSLEEAREELQKYESGAEEVATFGGRIFEVTEYSIWEFSVDEDDEEFTGDIYDIANMSGCI